MKLSGYAIVALGLATVVALAGLQGSVEAATSIQEGASAAQGDGMPSSLFGVGGTLTAITNAMLFIAGALSVVMIIVGGLRYVLSGGNAATVTAAKNTIMYAIVGLIIAFLAFAAINFVLGALLPGSQSGWTNA